jgi:hypothetical protein
MRVSAIIVSWNNRDLVLRCVRSAFASASPGLEVEVILSDNGSEDGTADAVEAAFPSATVIRNGRNLGFAAGVNRGAARATGERLLLLNSDAELTPAALRGLSEALDRDPGADAAAPRLVHPDGSEQRCAHPLPTLEGIASKFTLMRLFGKGRAATKLQLPPPGSPPVPVDYVIGAVVLLRRDAVPGAGVLDEDFFFYFEDTDLCRRLRDRGRRILYCPAVEVLHQGGASSEKNYYRITRTYFRSLLTYLRKHHVKERPASWWVLFKLLFTGNLLYDLIKHLPGMLLKPSKAGRRWNRIRALSDLVLNDLRGSLEGLTRRPRRAEGPGGPCPICGERGWRKVITTSDLAYRAVPDVFILASCRGCGFHSLQPPPSDPVLQAAYPAAYEPHTARESGGQGRLPSFWELAQLGPGTRVLDVGCGAGRYAGRVLKEGCEVWGIEPDPQAAEAARALGVKVHTGLVEDAPFPRGYFDVVSLIHVIEHVRNPVEMLRRAAEFLRPGGRMLLLTPNVDSIPFRIFKEAWFPLETPRHLHLFSPATLGDACRRAGLRVLLWRPEPHPNYVRHSLEYWGRPRVLALSKTKTGRRALRWLLRLLFWFRRDGEEIRLVASRGAPT